jgi:hypothetical protein
MTTLLTGNIRAIACRRGMAGSAWRYCQHRDPSARPDLVYFHRLASARGGKKQAVEMAGPGGPATLG